jgi:hypothetical protein
MQDPDNDGKITQSEWQLTALNDLFDVSFVDFPAVDDVNVALTLDSALLTGSPDATVTLVDADLSAAPVVTPTFTLNDLDHFANLTPSQMLGGLTQLVASLSLAQSNAAGELPFIQGTLDSLPINALPGQDSVAKLFETAKPVVDFLENQTAAEIICGINNNGANAPTGGAANLPAGSTIYCQATTQGDAAGPITWLIGEPGAANDGLTGGTLANTVGPDPSQSVIFENVSGTPDVKVSFTDVASTDPRAVDPIQSVRRGHARVDVPAIADRQGLCGRQRQAGLR